MRTPFTPNVGSLQDPTRESFLGIDPSLTGCAVCHVLEGQAVSVTRHGAPPTLPYPSRLAVVREFVMASVLKAQPLLIAMESEIWTADPSHSSVQSGVQAILQTAIWEARGIQVGRQVLFLSVNPSHVKKYVGAQKKNEVLLQVYKKFKREFSDDNDADAFVIGMIGAAFYDYKVHGLLWPDLTKPQIEVLDKLLEKGLVWEPPPPKAPKVKKERKGK